MQDSVLQKPKHKERLAVNHRGQVGEKEKVDLFEHIINFIL